MRKALLVAVVCITATAMSLGLALLGRQLATDSVQPSSPLLAPSSPSGHLELRFDNTISPQVQKALTSRVLPAMTQLLGKPWNTMTVWVKADPKIDSQAETSNVDCQPGTTAATIYTRDGSYLPWLIHELAHTYHGCFLLDGINNNVEEGLAEATKLLLLQKLHLSDPPAPAKAANCLADGENLDSVNNRIGIGAGQNGKRAGNGIWSCMSERLAGSALAKAEDQEPGFLRDWGSALYQGLRRFGYTDTSLGIPIDPLAIGQSVWPGFHRFLATQHIFDARPFGNQIRIFAFKHFLVIAGVRRTTGANESKWRNLRARLTVSQDGNTTVQGPIRLDREGNYKVRWAQLKLDVHRPLSIQVSGGGQHDQLTLTPQPHS